MRTVSLFSRESAGEAAAELRAPAGEVSVHLIFIALVAVTAALAVAVLFLLGTAGEITGLLIAGLVLLLPLLTRKLLRSLTHTHGHAPANKRK